MSKSTKKAYKKPGIKTEKIIETAALSCGKCIAGNPVFMLACRYRIRVS